MFCTYILKSRLAGKHYIGHCVDIKFRLAQHNRGNVRSTKAFMPWQLIYEEEFKTKQEAYRREREIKKYKGGEAFKKLIPS